MVRCEVSVHGHRIEYTVLLNNYCNRKSEKAYPRGPFEQRWGLYVHKT